MAVLERSELEASPLADLHAIADQLGLDGFRRLRKAELIDAILGERERRRAAGRADGRSPRAPDAGADGARASPRVRASAEREPAPQAPAPAPRARALAPGRSRRRRGERRRTTRATRRAQARRSAERRA